MKCLQCFGGKIIDSSGACTNDSCSITNCSMCTVVWIATSKVEACNECKSGYSLYNEACVTEK